MPPRLFEPPLLILADSLSMPRPDDDISPEETWPFILQHDLSATGKKYCLYHRGKRGAVIDQLRSLFEIDISDYMTFQKGSVAIVHAGIVDCAPRPIPNWFRSLILKTPYRVNSRVLGAISRNRAKIIKSGIRFQSTTPKKFGKEIALLLTAVAKSFEKILVVGVLPADELFEKVSPGITQSVSTFNSILEAESKRFTQCQFVSSVVHFGTKPIMDGLVSPKDFHHLTKLGHRRLAEVLLLSMK